MDKQKAQEILNEYIQEDNSLYCLGHYLSWNVGSKKISLDCEFEAEELEAIVWWMKNFRH